MVRRFLILSPHTDDANISMGAVINQLAKRSKGLHVAFSICRISVPPDYPEDVHYSEFIESNKLLGVESRIFDYPNRIFPSIREKICQEIYDLKMNFDPDVVFCPYIEDAHQDHQTVAKETLSVFKRDTSILMYEIIFNCPSFNPNIYFIIDKDDLKKKIDALKCYKSIWKSERFPHLNEDAIISMARFRGLEFNSKYAEAFYSHRFNMAHWW